MGMNFVILPSRRLESGRTPTGKWFPTATASACFLDVRGFGLGVMFKSSAIRQWHDVDGHTRKYF